VELARDMRPRRSFPAASAALLLVATICVLLVAGTCSAAPPTDSLQKQQPRARGKPHPSRNNQTAVVPSAGSSARRRGTAAEGAAASAIPQAPKKTLEASGSGRSRSAWPPVPILADGEPLQLLDTARGLTTQISEEEAKLRNGRMSQDTDTYNNLGVEDALSPLPAAASENRPKLAPAPSLSLVSSKDRPSYSTLPPPNIVRPTLEGKAHVTTAKKGENTPAVDALQFTSAAGVTVPVVLSDRERKNRSVDQLNRVYSVVVRNPATPHTDSSSNNNSDDEIGGVGGSSSDSGGGGGGGGGGVETSTTPPATGKFFAYPYYGNPYPFPYYLPYLPPTIGFGSSLPYPLTVRGVSAPECLRNLPASCTCYGPFSPIRPW